MKSRKLVGCKCEVAYKCERKIAIKKESTKFFGLSIKRYELPLTVIEKAWKSKASTANRSEKGLSRREKE